MVKLFSKTNPKPKAHPGIRHRVSPFYVPLMLAPIFLTLGVLFATAFISVFLQSLGYAPIYQINEFPTLKYYAQLFEHPGLSHSLLLSLYYAILPTIVGTFMSIFLALQLRKQFQGKRLVVFFYKLPLMVPYLVGVALMMIMFSSGGMIARVFYWLGFISSTNDFPQILYNQSGWGIMLVYLWKQIPFTTLILYSVLMGINPEYEEASSLMGASRWQTFWQVTFAQLIPGIVSASVIVFAFNFGAFEVPFLLGAGHPNTLAVEAWRLFDSDNYQQRLQAMAIVMLIGLVSSCLILGYLFLYRHVERRWRQP